MPLWIASQFKTKERLLGTIRESHTVAVHATGAGLDDFDHDSLPVVVHTGERDHHSVALLESRPTRMKSITTFRHVRDLRQGYAAGRCGATFLRYRLHRDNFGLYELPDGAELLVTRTIGEGFALTDISSRSQQRLRYKAN